MKHKYAVSLFFILSVLFISAKDLSPQPGKIMRKGTVYVPAYSSIYHSDLKWEFNLSITLSIHNVDLKNKIIITSINYYDTSGKLIHKYIGGKQLELAPLETFNLGIKETDTRGGVGANFVITWHSYSKVNKPVIETIMISTRGQQGLSFRSRGVTIAD